MNKKILENQIFLFKFYSISERLSAILIHYSDVHANKYICQYMPVFACKCMNFSFCQTFTLVFETHFLKILFALYFTAVTSVMCSFLKCIGSKTLKKQDVFLFKMYRFLDLEETTISK